MRSIAFLLLALACLIGISVVWDDNPEPPPPDFRLGVHLLMTGEYTEFPKYSWGEHLRYTRQMTGAGGWVMQLIQIDDLNVAKWQAFLEDCFALELRPVLRLATYTNHQGYWVKPPENATEQWRAFFEALKLDQTVWVVVGNEPNSGGEWDLQVNPREYADYFVSVAHALKKLDQPLQIGNGALDLYAPHTNYQPFPNLPMSFMDAAAFYDEMFLAQPHWADYLDFWSSHPYPMSDFAAPPWNTSYQFDRINGAEVLPLINPPKGIHNRGINGYEWEIWYMWHRHGIQIPPILITEFGYRHNGTLMSNLREQLSPEHNLTQVTAYLDMALWGNSDGRYPNAPLTGWTPLAQDPRIIGVIYFGLAGANRAWSHSNLVQVADSGQIINTYPLYDVLVEHNHDIP